MKGGPKHQKLLKQVVIAKASSDSYELGGTIEFC